MPSRDSGNRVVWRVARQVVVVMGELGGRAGAYQRPPQQPKSSAFSHSLLSAYP